MTRWRAGVTTGFIASLIAGLIAVLVVRLGPAGMEAASALVRPLPIDSLLAAMSPYGLVLFVPAVIAWNWCAHATPAWLRSASSMLLSVTLALVVVAVTDAVFLLFPLSAEEARALAEWAERVERGLDWPWWTWVALYAGAAGINLAAYRWSGRSPLRVLRRWRAVTAVSHLDDLFSRVKLIATIVSRIGAYVPTTVAMTAASVVLLASPLIEPTLRERVAHDSDRATADLARAELEPSAIERIRQAAAIEDRPQSAQQANAESALAAGKAVGKVVADGPLLQRVPSILRSLIAPLVETHLADALRSADPPTPPATTEPPTGGDDLLGLPFNNTLEAVRAARQRDAIEAVAPSVRQREYLVRTSPSSRAIADLIAERASPARAAER